MFRVRPVADSRRMLSAFSLLSLPHSADYPALAQVIRCHLNEHTVSRKHADHVDLHLSGQMAQHGLSRIQLDTKNSVRQAFQYPALNFYDIFICTRLPKVLCASRNSRKIYNLSTCTILAYLKILSNIFPKNSRILAQSRPFRRKWDTTLHRKAKVLLKYQ